MDPKMDCHMGRNILKTMKKYEDNIQQIELISGAKETHGSVRIRSIRMAEALKAKSVKKGDIIILSAVNHNDICIPYLASLYIGAIPLALTVDMKPIEIEHIFKTAKPRLIFADPEAVSNINEALNDLGVKVDIVNFGDENVDGCLDFSEFIKPTGSEELFECDDFDPKTTIGLLACSSGTTGLPKLVSLTHFSLYLTTYMPYRNFRDEDRKSAMFLSFSPLYWISGSVSILGSTSVGLTRLQSIKPFSPQDFHKASKEYNASAIVMGPLAISKITEYANRNGVNFPSFRAVYIGGSFTSQDLIDNFQKLIPNGKTFGVYGCTEVMFVTGGPSTKPGACGKLNPMMKAKIVDVKTGKELGPNEPGELCLKAPNVFVGYYNDPESTKTAFDAEGWYKTGDLMKIDDEGNIYFLERIKQLLKFRHYQIAPAELEDFIGNIPGVDSVGVVGIPHVEDGELPMAFVQLVSGAKITAEEIKDLVKEKLSDYKQLRGGVVFVEKLPLTYSGKVDKKALNNMKMKM